MPMPQECSYSFIYYIPFYRPHLVRANLLDGLYKQMQLKKFFFLVAMNKKGQWKT